MCTHCVVCIVVATPLRCVHCSGYATAVLCTEHAEGSYCKAREGRYEVPFWKSVLNVIHKVFHKCICCLLEVEQGACDTVMLFEMCILHVFFQLEKVRCCHLLNCLKSLLHKSIFTFTCAISKFSFWKYCDNVVTGPIASIIIYVMDTNFSFAILYLIPAAL